MAVRNGHGARTLMRLSTEIDQTRIRIEGKAATIIDDISRAALDLGIPPPERLARMRKHLRTHANDPPHDGIFEIVVCGRFRNGKSTFINALLGKTTAPVSLPLGEQGPMPAEDGIPTTATLTQVRYSEQPYVRAWWTDKSGEEWSFERYLREARLWVGTENNYKQFKDIERFEVGYPAELLKTGVVLIDSPGIDEDEPDGQKMDRQTRTEITRSAVANATAAIVIYRSDAFAGVTEQRFAAEVTERSGRTFTIINRFNGRLLDARFKAMAAERLGKHPKAFIDDPSKFDVYGVDAKAALDATFEWNSESLERSGLIEFEKRLSDFLLEEKYPAYVKHVVNGIDQMAAQVEKDIDLQRGALKDERDRLDQALEVCGKKLADIERRGQRIADIIERAKRRADREAIRCFQNLILKMCNELPSELTTKPIPSLKTIYDKFKAPVDIKQEYIKDTLEVLNTIVKHHLREWVERKPPDEGLVRELTPILEEMREDIREEINKIDHELSAVSLTIGSLDPSFKPEAARAVSMWERVLSSYAFLLFDPTGIGAIVAGISAYGGFRAGAGAAGAGLAVGVTLATFGVALTSAVIPAAIAALVVGIFIPVKDVEAVLKKRALKIYIPELRKLATDPSSAGKITSHLNEAFNKLKDDIANIVQDVLGDEDRSLKELRRLKGLARSDKEAMLAKLEPSAPAPAKLKNCREGLRELHALILQAT